MNYGDYLNTDDLFDRMDELETKLEDCDKLSEISTFISLKLVFLEELEMLRDACEIIESYKGSGEPLISEDVFTEYVEEYFKDCYGIDLPEFIVIDWESTAENLKVDYADVEIDGTTYYFRAG